MDSMISRADLRLYMSDNHIPAGIPVANVLQPQAMPAWIPRGLSMVESKSYESHYELIFPTLAVTEWG